MIDFIIKSSFSLFVFFVFYKLFLENEKIHHFNRFYLLFVIVFSMLIPFLKFEIFQNVTSILQINQLKDFSSNVNTSEIPKIQIQEINITSQQKFNIIPFVLWTVYGTIVLLLLLRFAKNIRNLILKSKTNPVIKFKSANLVLLQEKTIPHTFLNSIFINFQDYKTNKIDDELFTHELVHVTQKHTLDILFVEFLKLIFWFNPTFIFYKKAIQLNHEFLADQEIVSTYNNVAHYQSLLLQNCNSQIVGLTSSINYLVTKKRLIMMTKSTSFKTAILKQTAILPIVALLIYFFCIEVVAQEKKMNSNSVQKVKEITEKDLIRDNYYRGVYVKISDKQNNRNEVILYEKLSLEDKRKYLGYIPEIMIEKEIPESLFERMKTENMAVWLDGKVVNKDEIKKHKRTDFSYYSYSFIHKNARSKRFPQAYQYTLYTKEYFDNNLKKNHLRFNGDTIKISIASYKSVKEDEVIKILNPKSETIVWKEEGVEEYNLYLNEKKVVVIDVSHGGNDFGASSNELKEKNVVLEIAKKVKELCLNSEVEIHFTRLTDEFIELKERVSLINSIKPDLVISLHVNNSKKTEKNGFEVFVSDSNMLFNKSVFYAENLAEDLSKTKLNNGGLKNAPFSILKNSNAPSLVLELGYMSNENDKEYISSEKGQIEIAKILTNFISKVK